MQSTPYKSSTLEEGQYMNKDNNETLGGTDNSQSIVYENSCEIYNSSKQETQTHQESTGQTLEAGIENSKNEWQDELGKAQQTNKENIQKILRARPLKQPLKYQDYDLQ